MTEPLFYAACILFGLNGWLTFPLAIDARFDNTLQQNWDSPLVAPWRRVCLFGFSASAMFCCVTAWLAPSFAVFLSWAATVFSAASVLGPYMIGYGARGLRMLNRSAYVTVAIRIAMAVVITLTAASVEAGG